MCPTNKTLKPTQHLWGREGYFSPLLSLHRQPAEGESGCRAVVLPGYLLGLTGLPDCYPEIPSSPCGQCDLLGDPLDLLTSGQSMRENEGFLHVGLGLGCKVLNRPLGNCGEDGVWVTDRHILETFSRAWQC